MSIPIKYQKQLSELLAKGHKRFGKVLPRRPFIEDEGGAGTASLLLEHPLFLEQPLGASSDLTFIANENKYSNDEAEKRADEAVPELRKQLELNLQLGQQKIATPHLDPYTGG